MTDLINDEAAQKLLDGTTPGPWSWGKEEYDEGRCWHLGPGVLILDADGGGPDGVDENDEANACLIVAAPDLARTVIALHAELAQARADAKAAVALVVERAAAKADRGHGTYCRARGRDPENYVSAFFLMAREIRALADMDGLAEVANLRAEARESAMQSLASMGQAQEAYEAQMKAEAALAAVQAKEVGE